MQSPKVAIYYLNGLNTWTIKKALLQRGITKIKQFTVIPDGPVDPTVNFVVMIFDQDFKDYDMEYYTNGQPDWREDVVFERLCREVQSMHDFLPNAKIFLVDCTSMATDDLLEDTIDKETSDESYKLHRTQWEREKKVCRQLREKFFPTGFCVAEEFRLTSSYQEPLAERIVDLIIRS